MVKREDNSEEIIVDVKTSKVETLVDDLPSAKDSGLKPSLVSTNEPEPFNPFSALDSARSSEVVSGTIEINDELDAAAEAVTAKEKTPTPESIAAELKEVAEHAVPVDDDELDEEPETIAAPTPNDKSKEKKILPIIIAICVVCIAIIAVCLFLYLSKPSEAEADDEVVDNRPKTTTYDYVVGAWESQAEGGSCYVLSEGKTFYWLRDCGNYDDNYYYGNVDIILRGQKALKSSGVSFEEAKKMLQIDDDRITEDDVFLINLQSTERKVGGVDTTSTLGADPIRLLFVRHGSSSKAYGYQFNSGDMYVFAYSSESVL